MTLNIAVASPKCLIVTTDRRLTNLDKRSVDTERSTKLTVLYCADALALITYNGIGRFCGQTPADWLQDLATTRHLATLPFKDVLAAIAQESARRIRAVAPPARRHTFVIGAWGRGRTWLVIISNYENATSVRVEIVARPSFTITAIPQHPGRETRVLITGDTSHFSREHLQRIGNVAKKAGATGRDIKNLCVAAIQDTGTKGGRRGTVGTSVLWAIAERMQGVEAGLDVRGGTRVGELPNLIAPETLMREIRIEGVRAGEAALSWGVGSSVPELPCPNCGMPVPLGYVHCGGCGKPLGS